MIFRDKRNPFDAPNYDVFVPARRNDPLGVIEGVPLEMNAGMHQVPWIGLSSVREIALKYSEKTEVVDAREYDEVTRDLDAAREQLSAALDRAEKAEAKLERISGLSKDGYKVQRVVGRPAKAKERV